MNMATGHLTVASGADVGPVLRAAGEVLAAFDVAHVTLQCEPEGAGLECAGCVADPRSADDRT
jgi:hypothetical protein